MNYLCVLFFNIFEHDEEKTFQFLFKYIEAKNLKGMYVPQIYEYHLKNFVL